jgi:hypothetical protein
MGMEQIGSYYQCYKNRQSLNFVLSNYRKHYPHATSILVCDGGEDFLPESVKYGCHYFYDQKIETEKNLIFKNLDSAEKFILRMAVHLPLITEDFFILLEDDVYVMQKIRSPLENDVNGCNKNEFFSEEISSIIREKNPKIEGKIFYGSFGGSILRTEFFKKILSNTEKVNTDLAVYFQNTSPLEWASDKILTYLCMINGGTIGHYDGLFETWYDNLNEKLISKSVEVLHQYKEHYLKSI